MLSFIIFRDHTRKGDHLSIQKVSSCIANPFPKCSEKVSSQDWTELAEGKILLTPRHWKYKLTSIPALLVQRRLRWFGYAARRPEGELFKDLLLPTPTRTLRMRAGGQLKTSATTIKIDLEPISRPRVFGHARWRKGRMKVSSELAQDLRDWSAFVRSVVDAIGDADSTHPG